MPRPALWLSMLPALAIGISATADEQAPVEAVLESTLVTEADHVRQCAFDGDDATYFQSNDAPGEADSFTMRLDEPVLVKSVVVLTGKPDGSGAIASGVLELSEDGEVFDDEAPFQNGEARAEPDRKIQAIRVRPDAGRDHPLVIREIIVDSEPEIRRFVNPVEITIDVSDAPEMKEWAETAARTCERWYDRINELLESDGYKPVRSIQMVLKNELRVPAMAGGRRITGSVKWFKDHPDDVGAMIHETAHIVQRYRSRNTPSWLVEGVADYVRFFHYEPDNIGRFNPKTARHDSSYRVSARFLAYLVDQYDEDLVLKLNKAMREGSYNEELFEELTGKPLQELGEEWRASIQK